MAASPDRKTDLISASVARDSVSRLAGNQISVYEREPRELVSHTNREQSALDGYRGRQLLELLQNADDAAAGRTGTRLVFDLTKERLIVANEGEPFSRNGLTSLVISDCSPKQLDRNRFIGCKGLGFRSVLTWTNCPAISSGHLDVAFDQAHAMREVRRLTAQSADIATVVSEFERAEGHPPVPVMRFPFVPAPDHPYLDLASRYRANGRFDTVVVLPFTSFDEDVYEDVRHQLETLPTEALLFCRRLSDVAIEGDVRRHWVIRRTHSGSDRVRVAIENDERSTNWTIYRREGTVPAPVSGRDRQRDFESAIAVPEANEASGSNTLCVFFPTHDSLPLPLVLHATLELSDDRNRVHDTPANRLVLSALAQHLADVVEVEAQERITAGGGIGLLGGLDNADPELKRLGFLDAAVAALRVKSIFPRLDGGLATADQVRKVPHDGWLRVVTAQHFPEVLKTDVTEAAEGLLSLFEVSWYAEEELEERMRALSDDLPPRAAGEFVGRLLADYRFDVDVRKLIRTADGSPLRSDARCFFTPVGSPLAVPAWLHGVQFVDPEFQAGIQETSESTLRSLADALSRNGAKVDEYRLETLARAVVAGVQEVPAPEQPRRVRDLLRWLFSQERTPAGLADAAIPVIDTEGGVVPARQCYLGGDYPGGRLLARLYRGMRVARFVASPQELGLEEAAPSEIEPFLLALGVLSRPRQVALTEKEGRRFARELLDKLTYPTKIRGVLCESAAEARNLCRECAVENATAPEGFGELLKSDVTALVAYLIGDGSQLLASEVSPRGTFYARRYEERKLWPDPSICVPNPVLHALRTERWVPCTDNSTRRPSEIILSGVASRVLSGLFFRHAIPVEDPELRLVGGRASVDLLLARLGALFSLDSIGSEQLYDLLLRMPETDPNGEHAPGIYSTVLEAGVKVDASAARERFLESGKLWSRHGTGDAYRPIETLRYNSNVPLPEQIERLIPLAHLPRRRNRRQVEEVFGVMPLTGADLELNIVHERTEYDPSSEEANTHFRRALPYIYALRLDRRIDDDGREWSLLSKAELRLCRRLVVDARLPNSSRQEIDLSAPLSKILVGERLLVVASYDRDAADHRILWLTVTRLVSELLGVDIDASHLLACRSELEMEEFLAVLIGDQFRQCIESARRRFGAPDLIEEEPYELPEMRGNQSVIETQGSAEETHPASPIPSDQVETENPVPTGQFREIDGPTRRIVKRRRLVVAGPLPRPPRGGRGPIATEDVTFEVAEAFEAAASPPRYPLRVGHLRGAVSPGCDIISFRTDDARESARKAGAVADRDIERYIEVKGRSDRASAVELTDNEYRKADQVRDRYYLYRVYRDPQDLERYQVAVLQNPVHSGAVRTRVQFDLSEGSGAEWFALEHESLPGVSSRVDSKLSGDSAVVLEDPHNDEASAD